MLDSTSWFRDPSFVSILGRRVVLSVQERRRTSPSSLMAKAALSLVVAATIRRPHSAAVLCATHSPANGLVRASSSGSMLCSCS